MRLSVEFLCVALLGAAAGALVARRAGLPERLQAPLARARPQLATMIDAPLGEAIVRNRLPDPWSVLLAGPATPARAAAPASPGRAVHRAADAGEVVLERVRDEQGHLVLDLRGLSATQLPALLAGLTLEPSDAAGGFVVRALDGAGMVARLGGRVGDVVLAFNERPTRNNDEAFGALLAARGAAQAQVTLRRAEQTLTLRAQVLRGALEPGVRLRP